MTGSVENFIVKHEWECPLCHANISEQVVCFGKCTNERIEQTKKNMEQDHIVEHKKARALDELVEVLREAIEISGYKKGFVWEPYEKRMKL